MSLIIGGGITISGSININIEIPPGPIFEYNAGNSMCYSGSGSDFSAFNNGPSDYDVNYLFDLTSDLTTETLGNYGYYYGIGADDQYVSQGNSSYFTFDGNLNTYIDSNGLNGPVIPAGSSYTLFAIVNVSDFGDVVTPTGGIVGGDHSVFGFLPPYSIPFTNPFPLLYATAQGGDIDQYVFDLTTPFQPGVWYAVAVTYNSNNGTMKLYVDGVNTGTQTSITPLVNPEPLYWGTFEGFNWLKGKMSVMTAWDRALSDSEIVTYTNNVKAPYQSIPLQTYSQLFTEPGENSFVVPAGVTSISIVAVGAGASGTQDAYSAPGQLSGVFQNYSSAITATTTLTGTDINQIQVDGTAYPNILNVTTNYTVSGTPFYNYYPNLGPAALLVVSSIDTTDVNNVLITLNKVFDSNSGDEFTFLEALVAADGGYENVESYYNNGNGGPGPRAMPLVYNAGGGSGGVVDYIDSWGLGGGGAGGYGVNDPIVAFDPNQTRINDGNGDENTGVANVVNELSNNNLTVASTVDNTNGHLGIATGTYAIQSGDKVMFSLTVDLYTDNNNMGLGFGNYNANIQSSLGSDNFSGGFYTDGTFKIAGGSPYYGYPSYTTGDVIDIALDTSNVANQLTWIRVNGGDWMGDPVADPSTDTNGVPIPIAGPLYLMTTQGDQPGGLGQWSINTSNAHPIPSGYTFIAGSGDAGSTGGDGSNDAVFTAKSGQGIAGSGGGGAGRYLDSGTGGGGVGLYGSGTPGTAGTWASDNDINANNLTAMGTGGRGGSRRGQSGTQGGQATAWNGGFGGWPGGGGGSATGYYDSGQGGALAFSNNIPVSQGDIYPVFVGKGGVGQSDGGNGANGAVRIIWPGNTRLFPDLNAGIDPTGPSSIIVGTTDFSIGSGTGNVTPITAGGFVVGLNCTGGSNIIDSYMNMYSPANNQLARDITAFFRQAGMSTFGTLQYPGANPNPMIFNAYVFNVTWADSSTGKVRMSWNAPNGELVMSVIDTGYDDWLTASPSTQFVSQTNPTLAGIFNFPATFTPYTPLLELAGEAWC